MRIAFGGERAVHALPRPYPLRPEVLNPVLGICDIRETDIGSVSCKLRCMISNDGVVAVRNRCWLACCRVIFWLVIVASSSLCSCCCRVRKNSRAVGLATCAMRERAQPEGVLPAASSCAYFSSSRSRRACLSASLRCAAMGDFPRCCRRNTATTLLGVPVSSASRRAVRGTPCVCKHLEGWMQMRCQADGRAGTRGA
jgi:hypothetical protein